MSIAEWLTVVVVFTAVIIAYKLGRAAGKIEAARWWARQEEEQ